MRERVDPAPAVRPTSSRVETMRMIHTSRARSRLHAAAAEGTCFERLAFTVRTSGRLLTLGQPLLGERFETTAVPELRQHASEVASLIAD
jgi:hypothetical protein